jgi:hypothetical protein
MPSPPPPNAPSPDQQDAATKAATFQPAPDAASICGFKFPPSFSFSLNATGISIPLPTFNLPLPFNLGFVIPLKCDLSDPTANETKFGGGKVQTGNPKAEAVDF